jgi:CheY-like chemotaxis protein
MSDMAVARKILLVDDSRFYLELEKGFLRRTEAELLTARNGAEALGLIRMHTPDLVYMEQDLPQMDGAACCRQMKSDEFMKKIPVIMIHDLSNIKGAILCRESGCNAVLKKPLQRTSFLAMGKQFLTLVERREKRVPCRQLVILRRGDVCFCVTSVDLSEGGMYVGLDQHLNEADNFDMSFVMPGSSSDLVEAFGRVAWTNQGSKRSKSTLPPGVGIEFKNVSAGGSELIRNFVEKKLEYSGTLSL